MPKITTIYSDQFGELHKYHKTAMKDSWRRHGINLDDFDNLYNFYKWLGGIFSILSHVLAWRKGEC